MNWNYFSLIGYLSVVLWLVVPLLWMMHRLRGNSRWLCPVALVLALLAFAFARINSETHVNRIELDRSGQMAELQAQEEAKRKAAEDGRGDEVAQIRFAEDASGDFLDKAGMDEADLKYMETLNQSSEPEWKKEKKTRGEEGVQDDDIESLLGGEKAVDGMESDALQETVDAEPIVMKASEMAMAHRLDGLNLNIIRILILLAVLMVVLDYLRRVNVYGEASLPLPLPSALTNSLTPLPPVVVRPEPARRSMPEELAWLVKRGDSFVYLTDDAAAADSVPESLTRFAIGRRRVDVLRVAGEGISDDFVFEALWYGRSCFVVDSVERAGRMMGRFVELLEQRRMTRARVAQTVHVVWDMKGSLAEPLEIAFVRLAKDAGFTLFVCGHSHSLSESGGLARKAG